jgi:hypothetical protein
MDSPKNESLMKTQKEKSSENLKLGDKSFDLQVENFIQQQFGIFVPGLVFEYRPKEAKKEFSGWDYEDLIDFFSQFGDIELLEVCGKSTIILFKTFIDAYSSKEFLENSENFKEAEKNNFLVRWYSLEDEIFISEAMREKLKRFTPHQQVENLSSFLWKKGNQPSAMLNLNYYNNFNGLTNTPLEQNFNNSLAGQYNYYASYSLNPKAREEFSNLINSSTPGYTSNLDEDAKFNSGEKFLQNGKYTCKFEIQIENDNEFQVARRLIGAKVYF